MPQPTPVGSTSPSSSAGRLAVLDTDTGSSSSVAQRSEWRSVSHPNGESSSSYTHTPSLSISKAPAPLPVQLPTEQDLLPSPLYPSPTESTSTRVYADEEMGDPRMREVDRTTPVQANYPPSVKEPLLVPLPASNSVSPSPSKPFIPAQTIDTQLEPPNFQPMDNFETVTLFSATTPVDPSPASAAVKATGVPDAALVTPIPVGSSESNSSVSQAAEDEPPQPSVRLVGDGGTAGDASLVDDVADTPDASGLSKKNTLDTSGSSGKRKTEAV